MSYDVSIGEYDGNYTYNVSRLFHEHIAANEKTGLDALDGLTGADCAPILRAAWDRINQTRLRYWQSGVQGEPEFCSKYDAKNGWGSAVGALVFLGEITAACAAFPNAILTVR